ncbi:hypothetical protein EV646_104216 [Kribbella antiqua]|uniref:ParB-like nuclease family protein n=1 Tax=Kribbella antiqua TaxID=2512217 RepID=A0A4R2IVZ5_9ACTN|nr:hypothetical protein [Kribbella antiqua]TCO48398.1 hypothetical protein EV646_104216 [Kribbella antiqua]
MSQARVPFPLLAVVPAELRGIILDFHWDTELLHGLELPVSRVDVAELEWHLELPFWAHAERPFQVSPLQVTARPEVYPEQYARTMAADLRYPLDAVRRPDGRVTILDGVHRLLRAWMSRQAVVRVRVLEWDELDAIAVTR